MKTSSNKIANIILVVTSILIVSLVVICFSNAGEYKPFDAGVKAIQAELSLDSLDREVQLRNIKNN